MYCAWPESTTTFPWVQWCQEMPETYGNHWPWLDLSSSWGWLVSAASIMLHMQRRRPAHFVGRTSRSFREKHWALGKAQMFGQISARVGKVLQVPSYSCTTVKHGNVRQASRHPVGSPDSCAVCGRPARTRLGRQPSSRRVLSFKFRWMVRLWMCLTPLIPNTLEEPLWTKRQWQRE